MPKFIFSKEQKERLAQSLGRLKRPSIYINDGTNRVFLVPAHEKIFIFFITRDLPPNSYVGTFCEIRASSKNIFSIQRKNLPPNMLMTAHFSFRGHRPKKYFVNGDNSALRLFHLA